jgi:undecaprenyl-diphosphatase
MPSYRPVTLLQLSVIALIQGITEFLPVSSSGHLRLVPLMTGWPDQGLTIDIAVHVGTLGAVIVYFWRDMWAMLVGLLHLVRGHTQPATRLAGHLVISTVPVVIAGAVVLHYGYESGALARLRGIDVVGWTMAGFGIALLLADRLGMTLRRVEHMSGGSALFIGLAQVLALVPGTSRAGITMTAARMLGLERADAARFSLLMSVPTIIASAAASSWRVYETGNMALGIDAAIAAGLAFIAALIAIALMMRWLRRARFTPFVVYRVALGAAILIWFYGLV